ncbi:MAG: phosphate ABC transporter substrate-binding protein [Myxococcales bacterium]|nr:phosphate ABC transporter substrate-binding protein [Myxococcales bacterium]
METRSKNVTLLALMALAALAGCKPRAGQGGSGSEAAGKPITIKGSDTMVTLGQRWAEVYMKGHPGAVVQVTGGGSGTGISALINGTTDICQASRQIKGKETTMLKEKTSREPVEIPVAKDGLAVYVNATNPMEEISVPQLNQIFTGKVTNWKELGGADAPIIVYSRENSSGTYVFFKEHVLESADFAAKAQTMPGTASVVNAVAKENNAIGYGGAAYAEGIKVLKVKKDEGSPAVSVSEDTVRDGSYPLSRPLFFYLAKPPGGSVKPFIDWVLSKQGQSLVADVGYFPVL